MKVQDSRDTVAVKLQRKFIINKGLIDDKPDNLVYFVAHGVQVLDDLLVLGVAEVFFVDNIQQPQHTCHGPAQFVRA